MLLSNYLDNDVEITISTTTTASIKAPLSGAFLDDPMETPRQRQQPTYAATNEDEYFRNRAEIARLRSREKEYLREIELLREKRLRLLRENEAMAQMIRRGNV